MSKHSLASSTGHNGHYPFKIHGATIETHGDAGIEATGDIAPPLHPTTTFLANDPESHGQVYSRMDNVTRQRVESIVGQLDGGEAITYSSGLSAVTALIHAVKPRRILLGAGYFGVFAAFKQWQQRQVGGAELVTFITEEEAKTLYEKPSTSTIPHRSPWNSISTTTIIENGHHTDTQHHNGTAPISTTEPDTPRDLDLIWLESPNNPYGNVADLPWYAQLAAKTGALLAVDSTLSSPLGQRPIEHGAHLVMHSSTKYLSGHSDLLSGILITPHTALADLLRRERGIDGSVMGMMECWLLLRSLRTLSLRVHKQAHNVMSIVRWLEEQRVSGNKVMHVYHPYLPSHASHALAQTLLMLPPATFSFTLSSEGQAKIFCKKLVLVHPATSLGGVESLIDWRYAHDQTVSPSLLRVSIGVEEVEDLIADFKQALDQV